MKKVYSGFVGPTGNRKTRFVVNMEEQRARRLNHHRLSALEQLHHNTNAHFTETKKRHILSNVSYGSPPEMLHNPIESHT